MTGESFFLDFAKIGITVAGFASVVVALRHRRDEPWEPAEVLGLRTLIEYSFAIVMGGLLPSAIYLCMQEERVVWIWASALLALFLLAEIVAQIVRLRRAVPRKFWLWLSILVLPNLALAYLQVENAREWHKPSPYAAGLLWLLIGCGVQFYVFTLFLKQDEAASRRHINTERMGG